jgi:hypothetical protein
MAEVRDYTLVHSSRLNDLEDRVEVLSDILGETQYSDETDVTAINVAYALAEIYAIRRAVTSIESEVLAKFKTMEDE